MMASASNKYSDPGVRNIQEEMDGPWQKGELMPFNKSNLQTFPSMLLAMRKPQANVAGCLKFSRQLGSLNFYVKYLEF